MAKAVRLQAWCPVCRTRVDVVGVLVGDDDIEQWDGAILATHDYGGENGHTMVAEVDAAGRSARPAEGLRGDGARGELFFVTCPGSQQGIARRLGRG